MGYSYGYGSSGRYQLACDNCGSCGNTRKRKCPRYVLTDSTRGPRQKLHYCYPPALCDACWQKLGRTAGIHADCAAGAAASQREYDAIEYLLDSGELFLTSAFGDWHENVPSGYVGGIFRGRLPARFVLATRADWEAADTGTKTTISDLEAIGPVLDWTGPDAICKALG